MIEKSISMDKMLFVRVIYLHKSRNIFLHTYITEGRKGKLNHLSSSEFDHDART